MTPTTLIIVTDRGNLKAYKINQTPTRGPSLLLIQSFSTTDAHGRYQDKMTDQAGSFPSGAAPGQMNSLAERTGIENENDRRIFRQLPITSPKSSRAKEAKDGLLPRRLLFTPLWSIFFPRKCMIASLST